MLKRIASQVIEIVGAGLFRLHGSAWAGNQTLALFDKWYYAFWFGLIVGISEQFQNAYINAAWGLIAFGAMKWVITVGRDYNGFYGVALKEHNNAYDWIDGKRFRNSPIVYATYRFTIQGSIGGLICIPFSHSILPIIAGALMGPVYFTGCYLLNYKYKIVNDGFRISDLLFGYIFSAACTIELLHRIALS